jgi:hypothetical protein
MICWKRQKTMFLTNAPKQKREKNPESLFTSYLDEDEHLIWVGEAKPDNSGSIGLMLGAGILAILASIAIIKFIYYSPFVLLLPPFILLFSMALFRDVVQKRYYAISNKRLLVLKGNKLLKSEELSNLQDIHIVKTKEMGSKLIFVPGKTFKIGKKDSFPIYAAPYKFENLSHEDAQTAYDLLMTGWEEAEELESLE